MEEQENYSTEEKNKSSISNVNGRFTIIPNDIILDTKISNTAKCIYMYLSLRYNAEFWDFWNSDIMKSVGIKKSHTFSKHIKELEESGYIERELKRGEKGEFSGGYNYIIKSYSDRIAENGQSGENYNETLDNQHDNNEGVDNDRIAHFRQLPQKGIYINTLPLYKYKKDIIVNSKNSNPSIEESKKDLPSETKSRENESVGVKTQTLKEREFNRADVPRNSNSVTPDKKSSEIVDVSKLKRKTKVKKEEFIYRDLDSARKLYDDYINQAPDDDMYKKFVGFLFGENNKTTIEPLSYALKFEKGIPPKGLQNLIEAANNDKGLIKDKIMALNNAKDTYVTGRSSLYLTILKWVKDDKKVVSGTTSYKEEINKLVNK